MLKTFLNEDRVSDISESKEACTNSSMLKAKHQKEAVCPSLEKMGGICWKMPAHTPKIFEIKT